MTAHTSMDTVAGATAGLLETRTCACCGWTYIVVPTSRDVVSAGELRRRLLSTVSGCAWWRLP